MSTTSYNVRLEENTLYEGSCSLQYGPKTSWITMFHFNLSNDATQVSETYRVYVYQSECQTFHNNSGIISFTLQVSKFESNLNVFRSIFVMNLHDLESIVLVPFLENVTNTLEKCKFEFSIVHSKKTLIHENCKFNSMDSGQKTSKIRYHKSFINFSQVICHTLKYVNVSQNRFTFLDNLLLVIV